MPGTRALYKSQWGKETTWGTGVAATAIMLAHVDGQPDIKVQMAKEDRGLLTYQVGGRTYPVAQSGKLSLAGDLSYEQAMYLFNMGLVGGVTAVTTTGVSTWTWTRSGTAFTPDFYTIEYGDNQQAYKSIGSLLTGFELSGKYDDNWQVKADFVSKSIATATFTAALAQPAIVETPVFNLSKIYVGTTYAPSTQLTATLIDANIKWNTNTHLKDFADGALTASTYGIRDHEGTFSFTFEHNANFVSEFAFYDGLTTRFCKLALSGTNIISGVPTTPKSITINFPYIITAIDKIGEREGNDIVKYSGIIVYDIPSAKDIQIIMVNGVPTLL